MGTMRLVRVVLNFKWIIIIVFVYGGSGIRIYNINSTSTPKVICMKIACTKKCQLLNNPKEFNLLKRRCLIKTLKRLNAFETKWWRQHEKKNTVTKRTVKLSLKGLGLYNKEFRTGFIDREDCSCKKLFVIPCIVN